MSGSRPKIPCPGCGEPMDALARLCAVCANAERAADAGFPLGGASRATFGCIITFQNDSGQRLTLHETGPLREATARLCAQALALDPSYLAISYSTPETVYKDLQGHRRALETGHGTTTARPQLPEQKTLPAQMLHPTLRGLDRIGRL